jgi:alkylated DNA repair dioxygenase AlkB
MPFEQDGYTLHKRDVVLKGGRNQTIFFFARAKPKSGIPSELPLGYKVGVNKRTGLPYLKKS